MDIRRLESVRSNLLKVCVHLILPRSLKCLQEKTEREAEFIYLGNKISRLWNLLNVSDEHRKEFFECNVSLGPSSLEAVSFLSSLAISMRVCFVVTVHFAR